MKKDDLKLNHESILFKVEDNLGQIWRVEFFRWSSHQLYKVEVLYNGVNRKTFDAVKNATFAQAKKLIIEVSNEPF